MADLWSSLSTIPGNLVRTAAANVEAKANDAVSRAAGIPRNQAEALQQRIQLATLQKTLADQSLTDEQKAAALRQSGTALLGLQDQAAKQNIENTRQAALGMLDPRGGMLRQDLEIYRGKGDADTSNEIERLRAKTALARDLLGQYQDHEWRMAGQSEADTRNQFLAFSTAENDKNRALRQQQLGDAKFMGLVQSILGTGLGALALIA